MAAVWERQENETGKAYAAFETYLGLPVAERSIARAATILGYGSNSQLEKWSSKYEWSKRTQAYADYRSHQSLAIQEVDHVTAVQAITAQLSLQIAALDSVIAKKIAAVVEQGEEATGQELKVLLALIEKSDGLKRRNAGLPTAYRVDRVEESDHQESVFYIGE